MKKVLFSATVLKGHILKFHIPYLKWFKEKGYEVWVIASNDTDNREVSVPYCDVYIDLPFSRSPFSLSNIKAYFELQKIIFKEKFDIIHTHTPICSIITRLAAKKSNSKVIYTAHGFHFYKGAPLVNWLLFYPIEKYASKYTDILITINKEDYLLAKNKFKMKKLCFVNGVGVDFSRKKINESNIRKELNISKNDFVIISVGELNKNKNHKVVMNAINCNEFKNVKYLIAGDGKLKDYYNQYIKDNNLEDRIYLLGFREDIFDLLNCSDLFVFPSLREGLPVSIMEAMYCGLPCVVSDIRGNRDLIVDEVNGFLCSNVPEDYKNRINLLVNNEQLIEDIRKNNLNDVQKYLIENVINEYIKIYEELIK